MKRFFILWGIFVLTIIILSLICSGVLLTAAIIQSHFGDSAAGAFGLVIMLGFLALIITAVADDSPDH